MLKHKESSYKIKARRYWKDRVKTIDGKGSQAVLLACIEYVRLFEIKEKAEKYLQKINHSGCCPKCHLKHEYMDLTSIKTLKERTLCG